MSYWIFDIICLIIVLLGIITGLKRGAVKILFSLAAIVISALFSYLISSPVASLLSELISPKYVGFIEPISILLSFIILAVGLNILAVIITKLIKRTFLGFINKFLGATLGAASGIVVVFVFCLIISLILNISETGVWYITPKLVSGSLFYEIFRYIF